MIFAASIIGSWLCFSVPQPSAHFAYTFRADGLGTFKNVMPVPYSPVPGMEFRYWQSGAYVFERRFKPKEFGAVTMRKKILYLDPARLRIVDAGYWHENHWTAEPDPNVLQCRRQ